MSTPEFPSDARPTPTREDHYVLEDLPRRERMLFGSLAYVLFPVPMFFARWDPFVRFHTRQGIGVALGWIFAHQFERFTYMNQIPEVSWAGYSVVTVLACLGIRNALALEWKPMPWVGRLVNRLPLPKRLGERDPQAIRKS